MGGADCTGPVIQQPAHLYLARRKARSAKLNPDPALTVSCAPGIS
jgi:hypothetical protein